MNQKFSKKFEDAVNAIVEQFALNMALGEIGVLLGLDRGKANKELYNNLISSFEAVLDEFIEEIKSIDGFKEIFEMLEFIKELGIFVESISVWITTIGDRIADKESFQELLDEFKSIIDELHGFGEEIEDILNQGVDGVEPNNPEDE